MACFENVPTWYYRGEGNASLVVAHRKRSMVWRLRKTKRSIGAKDKKVDLTALNQKLQDGMEYIQHVIRPNLGEEFVHLSKMVELPEGFAEDVNSQFKSDRPDYRLDKEVDTSCPYAVSMPDFCRLPELPWSLDGEQWPTIAVEIKPKWAFLPSTQCVSKSKSAKLSVCRFCMHQHLKVDSGKWKEHSHYCPIDLFSGNLPRMQYAMRMLFSTPQNNLRLFKNGRLLYSEEHKVDYRKDLRKLVLGQENSQHMDDERVLDVYSEVVTRCLLHVPLTSSAHAPTIPSQRCEASTYPQRSSDGSNNADVLPPGCVLHRILQTQLLDSLDIDGLYPLYQDILKWAKDPDIRPRLHLDSAYNKYWDVEKDNLPDDSHMFYCLQKVKEYLVSRTLKDCSVMVAMRNLPCSIDPPPDANVLTTTNGSKFLFSVAIIDTDPKSFDKIPAYLDEDNEVVQHFTKSKQAVIPPDISVMSQD